MFLSKIHWNLVAAFSNARGITNVPGAIKHIKPPAAMGVSAIVINSQDTGFFQNDTSTYATMISSDISEVSKVGPKSQLGAYCTDGTMIDRIRRNPDVFTAGCYPWLSVFIGYGPVGIYWESEILHAPAMSTFLLPFFQVSTVPRSA